jgi:hypothetical protein
MKIYGGRSPREAMSQHDCANLTPNALVESSGVLLYDGPFLELHWLTNLQPDRPPYGTA